MPTVGMGMGTSVKGLEERESTGLQKGARNLLGAGDHDQHVSIKIPALKKKVSQRKKERNGLRREGNKKPLGGPVEGEDKEITRR